MFKCTIVFLAAIACAVAKPGLVAPLAYSSPLIAAAPGVVTATSSQVIARNYNGIAAAPVIAGAPLVAGPLVARYVNAPLAAPLAYSAPLAASPLGYAAPLSYAAPALW